MDKFNPKLKTLNWSIAKAILFFVCVFSLSSFNIAKAETIFNLHLNTDSISVLDPGFTLNENDIDKQWGLVKAKFPKAWVKTLGNTKIKVAVIDTGVDETHEDLKNINFLNGYNVITSSIIPIGTNSDDNGHGTLVTGVIAATQNNRIGIAGASPLVSIIPVKALTSSGEGSAANIAKAIVWATDSGADVINLSMGGVGYAHDTVLADSISYAFSRNVVIVAAAGNDAATTGGNLDLKPVFPVCDDNGQNMIIGVAATDFMDQKAVFSNYGQACVDVSAPGKRILSTINHDPLTGLQSPDSYAYASGTSMATPFVTAEVVLLKALYPTASNTQIRDIILQSADKIDTLNSTQCSGGACDGLLGAGRINADAAVNSKLDEAQIKEGDLVVSAETDRIYLISGGKKLPVSSFVKNQRYDTIVPKRFSDNELSKFSEGTYALPEDGTLVKQDSDPTVFIISKGLKIPISYEVFLMHQFSFNHVQTVSWPEINSWVTGALLLPPEGVLIKAPNNPTVYWVIDNALHPISARFFEDRGLNIFPIVFIPDFQIAMMSKGESYY
jgi:subtilisin family serine protease